MQVVFGSADRGSGAGRGAAVSTAYPSLEALAAAGSAAAAEGIGTSGGGEVCAIVILGHSHSLQTCNILKVLMMAGTGTCGDVQWVW